MYKISLTISALFMTIISFAQNNNLDFKYGLKLYNMTSYEKNTNLTIYDTATGLSSQYEENSLQILHPTVAFLWKSEKNNFHEVELTSLRFGKSSDQTDLMDDLNETSQTIQGSTVTHFDISMRYEFILNFNKSKDRKLMPSIGFGANPYFNRTSSMPKTANSFPTWDMQTGIRGYVTPRLTYFMTSKLFLDLNLPFCIMDLNLNNSKHLDPTVPVEEQSQTTFNFQQFPKQFSGRIGIGLKL